MNRSSSFLIAQGCGAVVFGIVALVVAFLIPDRGLPFGILPLIIGIVLVGTALFAFVLAAKKRKGA